MFGKNKKEQNDVDKYLSKKQRNAPCLRYLSRCYRNPRWTFLQDYGS